MAQTSVTPMWTECRLERALGRLLHRLLPMSELSVGPICILRGSMPTHYCAIAPRE